MPISRQHFIAGSAGFASVAFLRFPAQAAEFTYKLGMNLPDTHPQALRAVEAATRIRQETNGRLDVHVFPNNMLGDDGQMLAQTRSGAMEFVQMADAITATIVPEAGIGGVPFAFGSYKEAWAAMDGPLGGYIRSTIAAKLNVYPFEKIWDAGFKEMSNSKRPINVPGDLSGLKFRVATAPITVELYKGLGASPLSLNLAELYTSLQTHLVDGADIAMSSFQTGKFYEVQKFLSLTNHTWTGFSMLANRDAWNRLPKNVQQIAERNFNASAMQERDDIERLSNSLQSQLTKEGMTVNKAQPAPFRQALGKAGAYAQWRSQFGPQAWALLEKTSGKLA